MYVITSILITSILGLTLIIPIGWRMASNFQSFPCPTWLLWLVELENPFTKINKVEVVINHLGLKSGMKVLDAGCGSGRISVGLAKKVGFGGEVVALDIQPEMIERAKENSENRNLRNIRFKCSGILDSGLEPDQFDRAVMVMVLGEIPDRKSALKEVFKTLKPGGILSVTELIFDPHFQSHYTVSQFAVEAGFRETAIHGNRFAYTLIFRKPFIGDKRIKSTLFRRNCASRRVCA